MNGCVFGNQERATLSPKMALTIESRDTGDVLELSWRNDPMKIIYRNICGGYKATRR